MSKLIVQAFLSLLVSLGLAAGATPNVRGEVKQIWHETKAIVHQTVDFAADTASDLISLADAETGMEADVDVSAETNSDVNFGDASIETEAEAEVDTQVDLSAETELVDGFLLNLGGGVDTELELGLGLGE